MKKIDKIMNDKKKMSKIGIAIILFLILILLSVIKISLNYKGTFNDEIKNKIQKEVCNIDYGVEFIYNHQKIKFKQVFKRIKGGVIIDKGFKGTNIKWYCPNDFKEELFNGNFESK